MDNLEFLEEVVEEDVVFNHDTLSERNRKHRRADAMNWRRDRKPINRYSCVNKKLCKRMLHKRNRKDPDVCSSTYYKADCALFTVYYALS